MCIRYSRLRTPTKVKKFSMNYLDTLDSSDPNGWSNRLSSRPKRFSMNFRDTIEASDPRSWDNLKVRGVRGGGGRGGGGGKNDINYKRSDAVAAVSNAQGLVRSIEVMTSFMVDKYGLAFVCGQKELHDLLDMRLFLKALINQKKQPPMTYYDHEFDPLDCSHL